MSTGEVGFEAAPSAEKVGFFAKQKKIGEIKRQENWNNFRAELKPGNIAKELVGGVAGAIFPPLGWLLEIFGLKKDIKKGRDYGKRVKARTAEAGLA